MVALDIKPQFGYVVAEVLLYYMVNFWMSMSVGGARRKYKVNYPVMYADESSNKDAKIFNCTQRAHQNSVEFAPLFLVLLVLSGLQFPLTASICGLVYNLGRIVYFKGYSTGVPNKRVPGFMLSTFSLLGLAVAAGVWAYELLKPILL